MGHVNAQQLVDFINNKLAPDLERMGNGQTLEDVPVVMVDRSINDDGDMALSMQLEVKCIGIAETKADNGKMGDILVLDTSISHK